MKPTPDRPVARYTRDGVLLCGNCGKVIGVGIGVINRDEPAPRMGCVRCKAWNLMPQ